MRVFLLSSTPPTTTREAAQLVLHETIALLLESGQEVVLQILLHEGSRLSDDDEADMRALAAHGLELQPPLLVHTPPLPSSRLRANARRVRVLAAPRTADFYPSYALRREVRFRISSCKADVVLVVWSPEGLASAAESPVPIAAYYGVPDHLGLAARLGDPEIFGIPTRTLADRIRLRESRAINRRYGRAHYKLMNRCAIVTDLCKAHVDLYREHHHADARYVPNTYPDRARLDYQPPREPGKLIGSIGDASATGNTLGLWFLGREIVPLLRQRIGSEGFRVHVLGRSLAPASVEAVLSHEEIVRRGWVEDIDAEIRSANAFLLLNNWGAYQGAYTRVLHAWSLGACLIAHKRLAKAMPEVVAGHNALLGSSAEEIVEHVARVLGDPELRDSIGANGRRTYEESFRPRTVVTQLLAALRAAHKAAI